MFYVYKHFLALFPYIDYINECMYLENLYFTTIAHCKYAARAVFIQTEKYFDVYLIREINNFIQVSDSWSLSVNRPIFIY